MKTYIYLWYLCETFLEWEMFKKKVVQYIKTQILCSITFSRTSCRLRNNVEKSCTDGQVTHDNTAHGVCILDKLVYKQTHTEYVIFIACPRQQLLGQNTSISHLFVYCLSCNIILPSMSSSSKWSFSLSSPHQRPVCTSPVTIYATTPAHPILIFLITWTIFTEMYRSYISTLYSLLLTPVTSFFIGPNLVLSSLFSNDLSLRSHFHKSVQVSHPHTHTIRQNYNSLLSSYMYGKSNSFLILIW